MSTRYRTTEQDLFEALRPLYPPKEYALLPQVANATGTDVRRHADAIAMSLWPSRGLGIHGFEMKSYRGDWIRELRNPEKAEEIHRKCNCWWIVTADKSIAKPEELPDGWGLYAYDSETKRLALLRKATPRETGEELTAGFVAALLRKAQDVVVPEAQLKAEFERGWQAGIESSKQREGFEIERLRGLQKQVTELEAASGLQISQRWENMADLGRAVQIVRGGTTERTRLDLLRIANVIFTELGVQPPEPAPAPKAKRGARKTVTQ